MSFINRSIARGKSSLSRLITIPFACFALVSVVAARNPQTLAAHNADPTFAEDVAPILYRNCTSCHHTGGLAPFSLVEYDSARARAGDIRDAVASGQMPPWHASGAHGVFTNDRRLTDAEKSTLLRWIDAGAQPGNLRKRPPAPVYASTWEIGTPDAVVFMPTEFVVPAAGTIEYQYFEAPVDIAEDKWVQAIEIMPGARKAVHHVVVFARGPETAALVAPPVTATPAAAPLFIRKREWGVLEEPPRTDPRNAPPRQLGALVGTTAPGTNVLVFPKGTALRLRKGTILTFQMHYTAHGHEERDRTAVGFRFASEAPEHEMFASAFLNGSFVIPAGAKDVEVPSEITATQTVKIWGLFPHTHVRGTRWQYHLDQPDSTTAMVLDVPRYDFNWQTYYLFKTPLEMTAGSRLRSRAWYDNSASNRHNPDATKAVKWGDQTWEEMQYTGFLYTVPGRKLR